MKEKTKYMIIGICIFLMGAVIGYLKGSATGMYLQTAPTPPIKCTDTDIENDPYLYGETALAGVVYPDSCVSDVLYQSYCGEQGGVRRLREKCENGCLNGECII